jgi:multiple sugar transport system ATP-binding protein
MASVSIRNVWKYYGKTMAVRDLNLEVEENSFLCILGPSGCGKSSTLRMLAGLEHISSGDIYFGDNRVNELAPKDRNIAMVFENYALYPHKSVFDNIANPLRLRSMPTEEIAKRVARAAAMLQIDHLLDRKPAQLSGGQKQRVAIGRAIVREPRVFLFDEPIAHLDAKLRAHMRGELKHLQRQLRTTTIYVTHDQMEALSMADRIAVMHQGVLQQVGTPDEIYHHPVNEWVAGFVGEPPMNFVDCRLESQGDNLFIAHSSFRIPLTAQQARQLNSAAVAQSVRMGIRPDDLAISNGTVHPGDGGALGRIFVTEPVGGDTLVDVKLTEEQRLLVRTRAGFHGDSGDPCVIRLNQDRIHLFSREDGAAYF